MAVNAISRRKTVLALVPEVTEGVPVTPTSNAQYTALQEGFSMNPSIEELESAELQASIAKAKSEPGSENPEASFSHYLRASGVEGQEPDYKMLLLAAFGAKSVAGAEYNTVAASTTTLVKVDAGEGASFERGEALLVKDPVNGYNVRNIDTPSTDDLPLFQALAVAPGTGVNLGKAVLYKVANEDHPTFTMWQYLGNGGATEMMSGCRVTEFSMTANAGEYVNADFSVGGIGYYFNPIEITASSRYLDFLDNATTRAASVAVKVYKDPHELATALAAAMNALGSANTFTCTYSNTTGKYTITSNGTTLTLKWSTGANTANTIGTKLGFVVASDDSAALTYTSDNAQSFASPYSPDYDAAGAVVAKYNEVLLGGQSDITCFGAQSVQLTLSNTKTDIPDLCEQTGKSGSLITAREVNINVVYLLKKYDAEKFRRFREGENTMLTYNFGVKAAGQWVPGKVCNLFLATGTITALEIADQDGLCVVNLTLTGYVEDGKAELFLNFL